LPVAVGLFFIPGAVATHSYRTWTLDTDNKSKGFDHVEECMVKWSQSCS